MSGDSPESQRNGYARQDDLRRVQDEVRELRDGLIGTPLFPGGRLGQITAQVSETQDDVRLVKDTIAKLPDVIAVHVRQGIRDAHRDRQASIVSDAWKIVAGVAVIVIAAVILFRLGVHTP